MKTNSVGILIILALLAAILLAWPKRTHEPDGNLLATIEAPPRSATQSFQARRSFPPPHPAAPPHPALELLDKPVSSAAEPFLVRGVQTVQLINQYRRRFPTGSHGDRLLERLAEKLFIDDYQYAVLATGDLNPAEAQAAYRALSAKTSPTQPANLDMGIELEQIELDSHTLPGLGSEALEQHHAAFMSSPNPTYAKVWSEVRPYDSAAQTDLFKDALLFASLHTQMEEWMQREQAVRQEIALQEAELYEIAVQQQVKPPGGASLEQIIQGHNEIRDNIIAEYMHVQAAYQQIFADRFRARGIDDPQFIQQLKGLSIEGVGGRDFDFP